MPVHDLKIHPRDRELIAATHGRSIWIVDIAPLEEMNNTIMAKGTNFFTPKTAYQYSQANTQNFPGNKYFLAPNPTFGAELVYRVTSGNAQRDTARIVVTNIRGDTIRTINGPGGPGLHRAYWDLRTPSAPTRTGGASRQHQCRASEAPARRFGSCRSRRRHDRSGRHNCSSASRS